MHHYARLLAAASEAVSLAGSVCRQVQQSLEQVRAITKDDKSPVTVADLASQAIVARILAERLGNFELVGEEDSGFLRDPAHAPHLAATVEAVRCAWPDATESDVLSAIDKGQGNPAPAGFWTLDPVDGTKGFLRGQQYAVSLCFIERGQPTVGALGCPNLPRDFGAPLDLADPHGCLYTSIRGQGAFERALDNPGEAPVRIRRLDHDPDQPISVCASVEKEHSNVSDTDRILQHVGRAGEPARLDSQAKYAVVARGQADAYLRLPTRKDYVEKIWDHAAGALIASEAGASVTDIFGRDLDFSHGRGLSRNSGVVCAAPRVHALMLQAIEHLGIGR
ncbi:MAG: 3'(2'),5'-bisphosphate nucleotidase [Phycisphaeraceae bacterium]|nr:3'(2'),5'-bisphosphate nucleotidase [Phycisphaeraceae bacterium]MCW5755436.1 3'(2'),5'-bisphosphate nucleotidase [Phycisphaeraceae bacterium]